MIVSVRGERILMVRQVDHQEQCALMADAWGGGEFVRPEPFAPLRDATALHDEGWRSWEAQPAVTDAGRPLDFPDLDRRTHARLFTEGIERACEEGDRAGLIASLHGRGLYEKRLGLDGPPPALSTRPAHEQTFIRQEVERQRTLAARIGLIDPLAPWAWSAYRLLQTWDALSLFLVWGGLPAGARGLLPRVPRHEHDDSGVALHLRSLDSRTAAVEPYPFDRPEVELPVIARWIENRHYENDADLLAVLESAPWETVDVRVTSR
jgi:hypothetical protein